MDDAALMAAAARCGAGGGAAPAGKLQAGQAGDKGAAKLSKKERMRLKKEARRRERQEGSDDEDAGAPGRWSYWFAGGMRRPHIQHRCSRPHWWSLPLCLHCRCPQHQAQGPPSCPHVYHPPLAGEGGAGFRGVDLSDPRFGALLTSHHFALDPTDPRFK